MAVLNQLDQEKNRSRYTERIADAALDSLSLVTQAILKKEASEYSLLMKHEPHTRISRFMKRARILMSFDDAEIPVVDLMTQWGANQ